MTLVLSLISITLLLVSVGCSADRAPATRPDDFAVRYEWHEGTLPPPYYYEYDIKVGSGAAGGIVMRAGYEPTADSTWSATFPVSDSELDALYDLMLAQGVFSEEWRQAEDIPVGGSSNRMWVVAGGVQYSVPSYVEGEGRAAAIREVYDAVDALVPAEIWADLRARQEQYEIDHADED